MYSCQKPLRSHSRCSPPNMPSPADADASRSSGRLTDDRPAQPARAVQNRRQPLYDSIRPSLSHRTYPSPKGGPAVPNAQGRIPRLVPKTPGTSLASRPGDRIGNIRLHDPKIGQLGPDHIRPVRTHRDQHNPPILRTDVEIRRVGKQVTSGSSRSGINRLDRTRPGEDLPVGRDQSASKHQRRRDDDAISRIAVEIRQVSGLDTQASVHG